MNSNRIKTLCLLCISVIFSLNHRLIQSSPPLSTLVNEVIKVENNKMVIPTSIKHIKLDIGLSYSAPMSQQWLSHENDLIIFGFEPNPESVQSILKGATKRHSSHGDPLEIKYIGTSFFLIPCALGISNKSSVEFYVTEDCGCSSIYHPKSSTLECFQIQQKIEVPIFSLSDFFDLFPFDTHPVIDYIKIDAQGSDLNIAKSAGHYLSDHVIYITLEAENNQYSNTINSINDIDNYMHSIGFIRHNSTNTQDPTYFNPHFREYIKNNPVTIFQKG